MKRTIALTLALGWVTNGSALLAQTSVQLSPKRDVTLTADTAVFVMKATEGITNEVEAGKLAASKASAADVKTLARRLVGDHGKASQELGALAKAKAISAPVNQAASKKALLAIEGLTGTAFDRAYVDERVKALAATIALFEGQVATGADADVKAWATKTLPTLRDQLTMAKKAQASLPLPPRQ